MAFTKTSASKRMERKVSSGNGLDGYSKSASGKLEGVNYYISNNRAEVQHLLKHNQHFEAVASGKNPFKGDIKGYIECRGALNTIQAMEKQAKFEAKQFESTTTSNMKQIQPADRMALISEFYPQQITNIISDVQQIDQAQARIFTMIPVYSDDKNGVNKGDEVFKTNSPNLTYTSSEIIEPSFGTTTPDGIEAQFTQTFGSELPLKKGAVKIYVKDTSTSAPVQIAYDNQMGGFYNSLDMLSHTSTVDYETGEVVLEFLPTHIPATGSLIEVKYFIDTENNFSTVSSVELKMDSLEITTQPREVKIGWSVEVEFSTQASHNVDIGSNLDKLGEELIRYERDQGTIKELYNSAITDASLEWDATASPSFPITQHYSTFGLVIDRAVNKIMEMNRRGGLSYIVVGTNVAGVISQASGFIPVDTTQGEVGSHIIGYYNGAPVIKNFEMTDFNSIASEGKNEFVVGFKGFGAGDASVIVAEFVPIYKSQIFENPNESAKRTMSLMSQYGRQRNPNVNYAVKGKILNY